MPAHDLHLVIVTGASRGLGLAVAGQLLARPECRLLTISRKPDEALAAGVGAGRIEQWSQDLARAVEAARRLSGWLESQDASCFARASLINNAGVIARPGPLDQADADDLSRAIRVGLEAPLLLTAAFLRATRDWHADRRVLNVSSGLGRRAMAGAAAYCAAKAGMDHASRVLALEGAKVVSLAPGVIDTDMQAELRSAPPGAFADRETFVSLKAKGLLDTPDAAARKLIAYLERADYGRDAVADVRQA